LSNVDPAIHEKAIAAVPGFLHQYYKDPETGEVLIELRDALLDDFFGELNTSEMHRRGFALAIGSFPKFTLVGKVAEVLEVLIGCTETTPGKEKWCEARRDAINAIMSVVKTVGVKTNQGTLCS
jgi:hypothetical protein